MRILLIEDEPGIARLIQRGLAAHGHQVITAESGEDGLAITTTEGLDLVLLDIGLPDMSGQEVLREIRRRQADLPVIMLTAQDDVVNKVTALDGGADDYLTKPFVFEELLARIRARTRMPGQRQADQLTLGDLTIDFHAHRVWRAGQHIDLSRREFALLGYFARNRGRLLTRQQILSAVWEYEYEGESNVVDVYVRYLRNKLDRPGEPSLFITVRGSGYRFEAPEPGRDAT